MSTDDTFQARLDRLVSLTVDEREALADDLTEAFRDADASGDKPGMKEAMEGLNKLDMFEQLVEQIDEAGKSEEAEAEKAKAEKAEIEKAEKAEAEKAEPTAEAEPKAEEAKAEPEAPADAETPAAEATSEGADTESEALAMAASAVENTDELKEVAPVALTASAHAGADVRGYTAGEKFRNLSDIAQAMTTQVNSTSGMKGDGTRAVVASLRMEFPEDRDLGQDATANAAKIDAIRGEKALLASGGFCAPLPNTYDIFGVGSTARPVRDSLPTFGATRGGIRYIAPPVLGSYTGAISVWTAINDANPTNPATKPVLKVNCANELTATTDAITLSLEFGNLMTRAFPELVQRHNQLALIEHARVAEKTLLSKISALSSKVTTTHEQGTARDLLISVSRASAAYRNRHRIPRGVQLRAILPEWVRDSVREDIATNFNMGVQDIAITDGQVDAWFASRGLRVTWHMDDTFAAQGAGVLNDFPATIKYWLFTEGTFLFLDGGTLDLGVIRDADLVGTNDYVTFVETFEGVAKVGIEALEVTSSTKLGLPPVTP